MHTVSYSVVWCCAVLQVPPPGANVQDATEEVLRTWGVEAKVCGSADLGCFHCLRFMSDVPLL
jgi:hypothetical protein